MLVLAAESHRDRSIDAHCACIESNVTGTFNLLQAVRSQWESHPTERQFGSLGATGRLWETTPYEARSPIRPAKPPAIPGERLAPHPRHAGLGMGWSARKAPSSPGLTVQDIPR